VAEERQVKKAKTIKSIAQVAEAKTASNNNDTTKKGNTTAKVVNSMKTNSKVTNNSSNASARADAQPGNTYADNGAKPTADQANSEERTLIKENSIAAKSADETNASKTDKVMLPMDYDLRGVAARIVIWWQLGLPACDSDHVKICNDKSSESEKVQCAASLLNYGQKALLAMAGPAIAYHGFYSMGDLWCMFKVVDTLFECKDPAKYGTHIPCDFDWVVCAGLRFAGKIDSVDDALQDLVKVDPSILREYIITKWTFRANYLFAYHILLTNWDKVVWATELLSQNGALVKSEIQALFEEWGAPAEIDLPMSNVEGIIGRWPFEDVGISAPTVITYRFFGMDDHAPYKKQVSTEGL